MFDSNQVIDNNTPKLEIVRFCHITLNIRQKLKKFGQNSYKNLRQLSFFQKKSKKAEYDEILKDSF